MSQTPPLNPSLPILLGIAGPSGSGKTTLARELATQLKATLFPLDFYYRDLSQFPLDSRDQRNFDHPDALESELFIEHIGCLARGESIQRPVYDFKTHSRVPGAFTTITPCAFIIVEGILALHFPELVPLYHFSMYVDAPNEMCLNRRIHRDTRERGRTEASIRAQWETTAKPMANQYVLPSQQRATLTVSGTEAVDGTAVRVLQALHARTPSAEGERTTLPCL